MTETNRQLKTPILLVIFNRPDTTSQVFEAIRQARPEKLYVRADGPRDRKPGEHELCQEARKIVNRVDWPCETHYSFENGNIGCRQTVCSGMKWFFEHVEEGIILEDDCLPSPSFFRFCDVLLARYRNDPRVMQISGNNYLMGGKRHHESYYFSKLADISGWATWRRAWNEFDIRMQGFLEFKAANGMLKYLGHRQAAKWLLSYLEDAYRDPEGIWSPAWVYAMAKNNGLVIAPSVNLVDHLGYGKGDSTYSSGSTWDLYNTVKRQELEGEIIHPASVTHDIEADSLRFNVIAKTDPRLILRERIKKWWRWAILEPVKCFIGRIKYIIKRMLGE